MLILVDIRGDLRKTIERVFSWKSSCCASGILFTKEIHDIYFHVHGYNWKTYIFIQLIKYIV